MIPTGLKQITLLIIAVILNTLTIASLSAQVAVKKTPYNQIDFQAIYEQYKKNGNPLAEINFEENLKPEWVQKDLAVLRSVLEEAQTSMYRYTDRETLNSEIAEAIGRSKEPMEYLAFVRQVARILKKIACGHSGWSHTQDYMLYRKDYMKFFPLKIHAIQNEYIVKQHASANTQLKEGDAILAINGIPVQKISKRIRAHFIIDGNGNAGSLQDVSRYFPMAYSNFVDNPDFFSLVIRKKNSKEIYELKLPALKKSHIDSILKSRYPIVSKKSHPLELSLNLENSSAVYTLASFNNDVIEHYKQNFNRFTDSVFNTINNNKIENLIIDIRGNKGGWTANGSKLFSYFIAEPINYVKKIELKKTSNFSFAPIIIKGQGIYDSMRFERNKNGLLEWTNYHVLRTIPPKNNSFTGQVYILTDDMCYSCSAVFSAMMRSHTNAIFIGSETGGAQCGQNGMIMAIQLPYSGLRIHFSTAKYTINIKDPSNTRGVIPDYDVPTTWEDIKKNKDPQMKFVHSLINKK